MNEESTHNQDSDASYSSLKFQDIKVSQQTSPALKNKQILEKLQEQQELQLQQLKGMIKSGNHKDRSKLEFRWKGEYHQKFCLACLAIGIINVTPKVLKEVLDFEVSRESIGSHLQKYRQKIAKDNGLSNTKQLTNKMFPMDYYGLNQIRVDTIKQKWLNSSDFNGLGIEDVKSMIKNMHK